ncbi:glycosyltransferase [Anditalea andensis]|uniref:Beta-lactamase regulatory protein n=1 Tax=Anditalea andensis TaxID=1048983 RepID=A0A074KWH9_9BACT|nr:glycosyltransferase [Anditalea andensis]KEO74336.1 beta-lactamase regulatory protein [Anditalea andensis]
MLFSIIIPVYNRPYEIKELLMSLLHQRYKSFEVIIIEDGSTILCSEIIADFNDKLDLKYVYQENTGQGFARNNGMKLASGDFYILFDSDCVIPPDYLETVYRHLTQRNLEAYGGPDAADATFSSVQKAMNYSMTSFFTTGGIRGKMKNPGKYQARGFNMGLSKEAFEASGGFIDPNRAEDIELSIRLKKMGFRLELIKEAYVYHKRRNTVLSFFKQSHSFGKNRVHVSRYHSEAIKLVHLLPLAFLIGILFIPLLYFLFPLLFSLSLFLMAGWCLAIFIGSALENKSWYIGLITVPIAFGQLCSYGAGLATEGMKKFFYS